MDPAITILELRKARRKLETEMSYLISAFEEKFDLGVTGVRMHRDPAGGAYSVPVAVNDSPSHRCFISVEV